MMKDEFLPDFQTVDCLLFDTTTSDVLRLFYDEVKEYNGMSYPDSQIIDGKTVEFLHVFLFIKPPKDSLEVVELLHEPGIRPGKISGRAKSFFVQAWQIQANCRVKIEYSPLKAP
jgi:hypothetical protein